MAGKAAKSRKRRNVAQAAFGSRTDVGLVRDHNEDSLVVEPPVYAVADGMGGHAAGEVASEVAIGALIDNLPEICDGDDLARAVIAANYAVIRAAREGRGRAGMGTTMTAAVVDGDSLLVAQVGDSRAYLLHNGSLQRITRDHSLVADLVESGQITEAQARTHPNRSVITRALGSDPNTLPDIYELTIDEGDRLLLCTDGLSSMVEDSLIESTLARSRDPQTCANALVNEAIQAGGYDNITVVVVDVTTGQSRRAAARARRRGRIGAVAVVLALVAILVGTGVGVTQYLNHVAFLTEQDGEVVICRGIPGEVLGVQTWKLDQETGVSVDSLDLPEATKTRLAEEGIRVDSVDAAEELLETWQSQADVATEDEATVDEDADADEDASADDEASDDESGDA